MKETRRFIIFSFLILSGCATFQPPATTIRYQQMLDTWNGKDINQLIYAWGPPTSTFNMPNGNKMYTWANIKIGSTITSESSYGNTYSNYGYLGGYTTSRISDYISFTPTWDCHSTAVTNSSGTIQSLVVKGNNCILGYSTDEVQKRLGALKSLCLSLKFGTHLRLTFYEGQPNEHLDVYFIAYNEKFEFISATKDSPTIPNPEGQPQYDLKYIKDITVL